MRQLRKHLLDYGILCSTNHKWYLARPCRNKNCFLQSVEPVEVFHKTGLANPHTVHCIPGGQIMISTIGDPQGNGKG